MEHLTKQQIILLTLLVSFVTSIATGIVTVSLINQAPAGTTNTIERVIEGTVAQALPSSNLAAVGQSGSLASTLTLATETIKKSTVQIEEYGVADSVSGLGVIINSRGTVMTDKSNVAGLNSPAIVYSDGTSYRAAVVESQLNGDLVFLDPLISAQQASSTSFTPVSIASFPKLGETAASLGGTGMNALGIGIVDEIVTSGASSTPFAVSATIDSSKTLPGSPLFDISGNFIGLRTSSLYAASSTQFYLAAPVREAFPK
jgi:S1-C subfamily serine protease